MSTWGQYTFELDDLPRVMAERLAKAGKWEDTSLEIETYTNLSGIFTNLFRGYMCNYHYSVDSFNDDVQIALEIIEANYKKTFGKK